MEGADQGQPGPGGLRSGVGASRPSPPPRSAAEQGGKAAERTVLLHGQHPPRVEPRPDGVGADLEDMGPTTPPAVAEPDGGLEPQPAARVDDVEAQAEPATALQLQDRAKKGLGEVGRPWDHQVVLVNGDRAHGSTPCGDGPPRRRASLHLTEAVPTVAVDHPAAPGPPHARPARRGASFPVPGPPGTAPPSLCPARPAP